MQAEIIKEVSMSPELLERETVLVRCRDCKHFDPHKHSEPMRGTCKINYAIHNEDFYCANGELMT